MRIDLNDAYIYEYTKHKYIVLFDILPDDLFNIVLNFIGYDEVLDIYDSDDNRDYICYTYIPKKVYDKIRYSKHRDALYNINRIT